MTLNTQLHTAELIGWDLDEYAFRSKAIKPCQLETARNYVASREEYKDLDARCEEESAELRAELKSHLSRPDLQSEMLGLDWSLGVIDLRRLVAFQRRISFSPFVADMAIPASGDWSGLMDLAFAFCKTPVCEIKSDNRSNSISVSSMNPNLQFRATQDPGALIKIHAGSPFLEVAQYSGRWFLRDGYHRAHNLLRASIYRVPAVIVHARTLEELGADRAWFFPKSILLSRCPPRVPDFLESNLVAEYLRPQTVKTLRIVIEESVAKVSPTSVEGEQQ